MIHPHHPLDPAPVDPVLREFYRKVFAWLEVQKMHTSKPIKVVGFGSAAHDSYWGSWELHLLTMVSNWKIDDLPAQVRSVHQLDKAVKLASLYDPKYLKDVKEILEAFKAWAVKNKMR
jgi:hypothetical protein